MVYVPAGEFVMGSSEEEGDEDERPPRVVYVDSFWIDRTEVTNAEYGRFVAETNHRPPGFAREHWNQAKYHLPDQPVVGVSWEDAVAYASWAGKRLPTEAEWEKAARGTDGRRYPWGDAWDVKVVSRCNFSDVSNVEGGGDPHVSDGHPRTAPVGSYPKGMSPYGCLDMAGNVWEWCADWYDPGYYACGETFNPKGPPSGQHRVVRGGCWLYEPEYVRCSARDGAFPTYRKYNYGGFRCAKSAGAAASDAGFAVGEPQLK